MLASYIAIYVANHALNVQLQKGKVCTNTYTYVGAYTVQITHNLNAPRVSHACHTRVTCTRGVGGAVATNACVY